VPAYWVSKVNGVTYYGYVTNYGRLSPGRWHTRVRFTLTVCLIGSGERLQTDAIVNGQAQQVITGPAELGSERDGHRVTCSA
jgi:hypothetical protein